MYLRDGNYLAKGSQVEEEASDDRFSEASFLRLQDQKAVLQEQHKTVVAELEKAQTAYAEMTEEVAPLKLRIVDLEENVASLMAQCKSSAEAANLYKEQCDTAIAANVADISTERKTYEQSRAGLDEMCGHRCALLAVCWCIASSESFVGG